MSVNRRVAVVPLGGTIACVPDPDSRGVRPSADPLVMQSVLDEAVRWPSESLPQPDLVPAAALASAELDAVRIALLLPELRRLADEGRSGIVVTTGTDSLEEVSFVLDLLWDRPEPLVVLGALRHAGLPGPDGPANLRDGLLVAADPRMRDQGVLVTMAGQVHHAWQVRKGHTGAVASFHSAVTGPAGFVQEDTLRIVVPDAIDRPRFRLGALPSVPAVAILKSALGDDGRLLPALATSGYRGLVVEAMGGGSVPPAWMPMLTGLADVMPIAYSSRPYSGPTLQSTYGGAGSELDLQRIGALPTGLLDGLKARLLLALLLAVGSSREAMARAFGMFDTPSISGTRPLFAE